MFWKNWSWPVRILSGLGLGIVAALILLPVFARSRESDHPSCQQYLKQIGLGIMQYTQDYDEHLPLVAVGSVDYGWANSLQPYLKSTQIFQCPLEDDKGQSNPRRSKYTDYWYNAQLSGRAQATLDDEGHQLLCGDGNDGADLTDARYSIFAAPDQWVHDANSPLHRHYDGTANYLFADGHVKMMKPSALSFSPNGSRPFFLPKPVSSY